MRSELDFPALKVLEQTLTIELSMNARVLVICLSVLLSASQLQSSEIPIPKPDILVVGAGISGLCAALEAARSGATVTVIDMASVFGGHAVMSSGMVCM